MQNRLLVQGEESVDLSRVLEILKEGALELQGRLPYSSNNAFLAMIGRGDEQVLATYKPARGERPLWDFETGTLVNREVAAYVVSRLLGFPNIPPTVLREGPFGIGAVQMFVDFVDDQHFFTLRAEHRDEMKRIAIFDAMVNNTDRKGGHVLLGKDAKIWVIDHGVTFHEDYKLRTVIWDFVGQKIPREMLSAVREFRGGLDRDECRAELERLLTRRELRALRERTDELLESRVFPAPPADWPHIPWPPV